jgi:hypothetical protein
MRLGRPCIRCGRKTTNGNYCDAHRPTTAERDARQPYRAAYFTPEYRRARRERFKIAGGRCEYVDARGRCERVPTEAHHVVPLSLAGSDLAAAVALCSVENLRAVCREHNPRGRRPQSS